MLHRNLICYFEETFLYTVIILLFMCVGATCVILVTCRRLVQCIVKYNSNSFMSAPWNFEQLVNREDFEKS